MAENNEENKVEGVFGGVEFEQPQVQENAETKYIFGEEPEPQINCEEQPNIEQQINIEAQPNAQEEEIFKKIETNNLPAKPSAWTKFKSVLFKEIDMFAPIKVELTPYQQKVEDEINEFLHQEISFRGFINILKS